jgi:membrane-associated phospholipid phosphatase
MISPLLVPIVTTIILLVLVDADVMEALAALSFVGFSFCLVPLADIGWMLQRGSAQSLDLPDRRNRTEPLSITILAGSIGLFFYLRSDNLLDTVAILAATYVANLALVLVINLFWKISVHAVAVAGMLSVVLYMLGPTLGFATLSEATLVLVLAVAVPFVGWARLRLRMHTLEQVVAGAALGFVGHWAGLYWMARVLY